MIISLQNTTKYSLSTECFSILSFPKGIPTSMFTVMFAMARCAGWVSHWLEMHRESVIKIGRPRQVYVGEKRRDYVPMSKRAGENLNETHVINTLPKEDLEAEDVVSEGSAELSPRLPSKGNSFLDTMVQREIRSSIQPMSGLSLAGLGTPKDSKE